MQTQAHEILKIYLDRKKLSYPSYSLRALARDLELSPSYVSALLTGQKPLPEVRLKDFIKVLDLDDIAIIQLKNALYPETRKETNSSERLSENDKDFLNSYRPLDKKKYEILNDWYNIAILDLTTCENFESHPSWIAKKLKITQLQVEIAIENLKRLELLIEVDGKLQKKERLLRFPTKMSQSVIRKFHKQMIKKAYEELDSKTEEEEFSKRLITGTTFAVDSKKINLLKEKIQNNLYEVASMASDGPCESVYHFNVQLFPLTKN
ncbi:MAG: TIGR02147 family protein [Bacteriovorax sp.]|nr:TIGR02147 family protein [Bacteriovorax sp.]